MPLGEIQAVLSAPDLGTRNRRIAAHLSRLEKEFGRTQSAVVSLRDLLAAPGDITARIELRAMPAVEAAAITAALAIEGPIREYWLIG